MQINNIKLKAAVLALKHFCRPNSNIQVNLYLENVVVIKYLNKVGCRKVQLNSLTIDIQE